MALRKVHVDVAIALLLEEEAEEEVLLANLLRDDGSDIFKRRREEGAFEILISSHLMDNETKFREYFRVSRDLFHSILSYIRDDISKAMCNRVPNPISPEERLCITLRFLATGESYRSLAFQYRVSHSWISTMIRETLKAICSKMRTLAISQPNKEDLTKVAQGFYQSWNFPNCCGSIDGKHIRIISPDHSGSLYFNYKDYFSVVLLALVDPNYKFLAVDVGSYGKEGDSGIFAKSNLGKSILGGTFDFPEPAPLLGTDMVLPYVIVGDEAFKLTTNMMRPYPREQSKADVQKAIYNYRHSRARRTSENAFGILCQYFRIFHTPIAVHPDTVDDIVMAACILHNLLRDERMPCPNEDIASNEHDLHMPKDNMLPMMRQGGNATYDAYRVRDCYKNYFCSAEGTLSWQINHVSRTN